MSTPVKNYLVFAGDQYYPLGGWEDFVGAFETLPEAEAAYVVARKKNNWAQLVDLNTLKEVPRA